MKGKRADIALVENGLCESRERAKSLIMEGVVTVDGRRIEKPGDAVNPDSIFEIKESALKFVSRGGLKLDKAISSFDLNLDSLIATDLGASTGGFTDCMLMNGTKKVYAIDVGYGQLDWKLRNDPRVVVMERTNARNIVPNWFDEALDFASLDLSFISVKLIINGLINCLREDGKVVVLVKPQFEAGRGKVGKNGVVRNRETHKEVILTLADFAKFCGYRLYGLDFSPITGPKGNIEFLLCLEKSSAPDFSLEFPGYVEKIVTLAHEFHKKGSEEI
ncbi:MAG: TlyA family RNA methyltransferase [Clostridia bacterium]